MRNNLSIAVGDTVVILADKRFTHCTLIVADVDDDGFVAYVRTSPTTKNICQTWSISFDNQNVAKVIDA